MVLTIKFEDVYNFNRYF